MNSFTVASDEQANDSEHLLYLAFGRSSPGPNATHKEQRNFTGHELDSETGYLYAKSRYLDSTIGRFISQDPSFWNGIEKFLADPQQLNSYSYARNNPLRFTDPDGEFIKEMNNYLQRLGRSTLSSFKNELYSLGGLIVSVAEDPSIIPSVVSQIGEFTAQNFQELYDYGEGFVNNSGPVAKATANRIKELIVNPEEGGKLAGGLILTTLTRKVINPALANRLKHIFGKPDHNLGPLLTKFGSEEDVFNAVQKVANQYLKKGKLVVDKDGILTYGGGENIIKVGGENVQLIGGRVVDDEVILSSFSRKGL